MGSGTSRQQVAPASSNSRNRKVLSAAFGKSIWIASTCAPVMAKIWVARSTNAPVKGWLRRLPISAPSSAQTPTACELGGCPRTACTPADANSMSLRFPKRRRKRPSAMGLRQTLPVQTKRTLFTRCGRANLRRRPSTFAQNYANAAGVVPLLPRPVVVGLAKISGALASLLDRYGRRIALANLDCAFGQKYSASEKRRIVRESYQHFAQTMLDLMWSPRLTRENFSRY